MFIYKQRLTQLCLWLFRSINMFSFKRIGFTTSCVLRLAKPRLGLFEITPTNVNFFLIIIKQCENRLPWFQAKYLVSWENTWLPKYFRRLNLWMGNNKLVACDLHIFQRFTIFGNAFSGSYWADKYSSARIYPKFKYFANICGIYSQAWNWTEPFLKRSHIFHQVIDGSEAINQWRDVKQ